ncbi:hypothetical protein CI102_13797 [Trichoderma harzianum]|nr:hypothetical protein CI102_13797 [Trichoderma harzianum]
MPADRHKAQAPAKKAPARAAGCGYQVRPRGAATASGTGARQCSRKYRYPPGTRHVSVTKSVGREPWSQALSPLMRRAIETSDTKRRQVQAPPTTALSLPIAPPRPRYGSHCTATASITSKAAVLIAPGHERWAAPLARWGLASYHANLLSCG